MKAISHHIVKTMRIDKCEWIRKLRSVENGFSEPELIEKRNKRHCLVVVVFVL